MEQEERNFSAVEGESISPSQEIPDTDVAAAESSAAFSAWTKKLRFDRSFTAKLILSDDKTKAYYADLASALLQYKKVKSKTGWSGVSFQVGRERLAFIAVVGKTLCLYLATDPETAASGKYKAKDVSAIKKRAKTPSMLKIKSEGAKRHALKLIAACAENLDLTANEAAVSVAPSSFKTDSFNNLVTRGLIRILRADKPQPNPSARLGVGKNGAYADVLDTFEQIVSRHGIFNELLTYFSEGDGSARLSEKLLLRSVDEIWVRAIEDCIPAIDELIRNPRHVIAETEEVLAIERTKRISGRSISHLCRHTDYLSVKEDGELTPTKMLNIFREDSLLTYENKFLNTLIDRLYLFVRRRYKIAKDRGVDEKLQTFEFENAFNHGDGKGKIKISVEYAKRDTDSEVKNTLLGTGLWDRVERLNDVVTGYVNSAFVKSMERNFVRPPIMRTNAILKNKYFRECLALWEFIESYEDAGYGIVVQERTQELSDEYVKATYAGAAMQYLLFRKNLEEGFDDEEPENAFVRPDLVLAEAEGEDYAEEFALDAAEKASDDELDLALQTALLADEQYKDEDDTFTTFAVKTFHAKLRLADEEAKAKFAAVCNEFLAFSRVKIRHSRKCATVSFGRKTLARFTVSGKTLKFYAAIPAAELPEKYNVTDVSDKKAFADTPSCLKVRSNRGLKYAREIVAMLSQKFSLRPTKKQPQWLTADDFAKLSLAEMLQNGWISFTRREKSALTELPSFGATKRAEVAKAAETATLLSVTEPSQNVEELRLSEVSAAEQPVPPTTAAEDLANRISGLVRPVGNYDTPTEYGIDDASSFLADGKDEPHKGD